jgi:hemolysin activation/secretion protein
MMQFLSPCPDIGRKARLRWSRLMMFSGLSSIVLYLLSIPLSAQAQQRLAQTPPVNQPIPPPAIPRDPIPEPSLPETPQPTQPAPPLETPPETAPPSEPQEPAPTEELPTCEITDLSNQSSQFSQAPTETDTITVTKFIVVGSTIFSCEDLKEVLLSYLNKPLSFPELLQARTAITELYTNNPNNPDDRYITTGAYIPDDQVLEGNAAAVTIRVVEGRVDDIRIRGMRRLNANYVRSRLRLGTKTPLNERKLLNALRLLQVDPLINSISAELRAGTRPGTNILEVNVTEAPTWSSQITSNNGRSPSVGSFRRGVGLTQANLLGIGDGISVNYNNTAGSNGFDVSYILPVSPRNATLNFSYGTTSGNIIEEPFEEFDLESDSRYYQLTFRQPIVRSPSEEFALGLTASINENETSIEGIGIPISPGANDEGLTRVSAIRFAQEYIQQNRRHVFAARSQFSFGINAFGATINDEAPDSRFFAWRGQLQWVQLFGSYSDNLPTAPTLFVRTDLQFADRPLLPTEQLGFGGLGTIRGYRQDALLVDNGLLATAELRLPVLRIPEWRSVIQLIPFVDVGTGWNSGDAVEPDPDTLASVGIGIQFIQSRRFSARLDWGIPLVDLDLPKRTWQENGVYFSIEFNPF